MHTPLRASALALLGSLLVLTISACGAAAPAAAPAAVVTAAPAAATSAAPVANAAFTNMSVQELKTALDAGESLFLLDVRTPEEFTGDGHIAGAVLIPVDQVSARLSELPKDKPIVCFCRSGNRSRTACETLASKGYTGLRNVTGGIHAWVQAGYPVQH